MSKVGIVLAGCGVYDGAEIREAVFAMLAVDQAGAEFQCYAPDVEQFHVIDHLKGEPEAGATRNVLRESARIARGDIKPLSEARAGDCAAWVFPGGFGAAKNLCDFAINGVDCDVEPETARLIAETHAARVPVAFCCIAPALAARAYQMAGVAGVSLTIGNDEGTAAAIDAMGAAHEDCPVRDVVVDHENRVVSTPAYMCADARMGEIFSGVSKAVKTVLEMAG